MSSKINDTKAEENTAKENSTGRTRALQRLQTLKNWQDKFYANTGTGELSRQFKRRLKRMVASKELAEKKAKALTNRKRGQSRNF